MKNNRINRPQTIIATRIRIQNLRSRKMIKHEATKVTFCALGMEHVKFCRRHKSIEEIQDKIKSIWETAHLQKLEFARVEAKEFNQSKLFENAPDVKGEKF